MSMESSWSYASEDKGFVLSNETVSPADFVTARSKNVFMSCGLRGCSYSYDDNSMLLSSQQQPLQNQGILEVGLPDMIRKQPFHDSLRNTHTISSKAISGDEESSSRLSNSVVDSNNRESSLIDLKLGRFGDNLNYNANTRTAPSLSSAESSTPSKRVKASSLNSQPAFCQVYGCNKDLSSSKDYHKRHKVCDVHSKTAKVIVNGLEQRFCQQCSRFHLLGEFDDGKRSCRRRLAGHNQRRRKPQVGLHSGRAGRFLHSYNGCNGKRATTTSFICQDILPSSTTRPYLDECGVIDLCKHIKPEDGADIASKLASCWMNGQLLQKSGFHPYGLIGKQSPFSENVNTTTTTTMTSSVFNETNFLNQYHHPQDTASCLLFQSNHPFDTASTIHGFPGLSESGCALSLLSSQSHNSHSPHHDFGANQVSENLFGVSSQGRNQMNDPVGLSAVGSSDFTSGFFHQSEYVNVKDGPSFDDGATIDLLQLSTQLERVEHQRQAVPVKQEDDAFCCLRIT